MTAVNDQSANVYPSPRSLIFVFIASLIASLFLTHLIVESIIDAVSYDLGDPLPRNGVLEKNDRLAKAEILMDGKVYGPECLTVHPETGLVYTGLKTGLIVEIDLELREPKITKAVSLITLEYCDGSYQAAPRCGRPLGVRFNDHGELVVLDAYFGVYVIDFGTEKTMRVLASGDLPLNDETAPIRYINDFDFLPDGRIILSESSTKFDDRDFIYELFEHRPNGRLLIYDPRKKTVRVLKDKIYFPNGVQVAVEKGAGKDDDVRVFYSEMGMTRIMTIWVPTDPYSKKKIRTKVLIDHLPGYPDNIRLSKSGHLFVPMPVQRTSFDRYIEKYAAARSFFTKVISPQLFNSASVWMAKGEPTILKVDIETGKIIDSWSDTTGRIYDISTVVEDLKGRMLLGSDTNGYIARLNF
ncbi:unnamed protein product [Caenorhabditis bovis]|uniref:Strictosidine synthase conserved region domain-containing protein n=1 Tax=Caenorhabditis bovis TaxID=2654633 RepID=A0A8S1F7Y1_9PELO|nr:unnamed protein product [Caenorhabditis bovis]